ncbi:MAG: sigma 54-interacting transcriptional regulator [Gemmatimonadaceae bacterium]
MTENAIARLILGESSAIQTLHERIARVAPSDLPVLIQGPSGSGKELVAAALHQASGRSGSLVAFNVCALAETMFESQLFGHVRGAFTGATTDVPGFLTEAHRGTLFLDEISSLVAGAQAKLLRAIDTGSFRPVGARQDQRSDFRVVAATNDVLSELVTAGRFRLDLFQRLSGVVLHVPPLNERVDDIALLARHFVRQLGAGKGPPVDITSGAIRVLQQYEWPGNVRELRHVLAAAALLAPTPVLTADAVCAALQSNPVAAGSADGQLLERRQLIALLEKVGGDTGRAALLLGVNRSTIYRRAWRLGVDPAAYRPGESRSDRHEDGKTDLRVLR